jgi:hypothetical protein
MKSVWTKGRWPTRHRGGSYTPTDEEEKKAAKRLQDWEKHLQRARQCGCAMKKIEEFLGQKR